MPDFASVTHFYKLENTHTHTRTFLYKNFLFPTLKTIATYHILKMSRDSHVNFCLISTPILFVNLSHFSFFQMVDYL